MWSSARPCRCSGSSLHGTCPSSFSHRQIATRFKSKLSLPRPPHCSKHDTIADSMRQSILEDRQYESRPLVSGCQCPDVLLQRGSEKTQRSVSMVRPSSRLRDNADARRTVHRLQSKLAGEYPQCRVLVRQLEQGPPFDAPIEIRLSGPDLATLQKLGSQLRLLLSQSTIGYRHTVGSGRDTAQTGRSTWISPKLGWPHWRG